MNLQSTRLLQISDILESASNLPSKQKGGWLSTVREALGMTVTTASKRANVSVVSWTTAEKREAEGTISISTLQKFLSALDCDLVYTPVPKGQSLSKMVERQALEFAKKEVMTINSTMAIEDQAPKEYLIDRMIEDRAHDIIRSGNWKKIW